MQTWREDDTTCCEVKSNGRYLQSTDPAFALMETQCYTINEFESDRYLELGQREMKVA